MNPTTVEIYSSTQAVDVHIAKTRLESEGIQCYVHGEAINQVFGGVNGISQGVSLLVATKDAERARQILEEDGYIPKEKHPVMTDEESRKLLNTKIWTILGFIVLVLIVLGLYTYFLG